MYRNIIKIYDGIHYYTDDDQNIAHLYIDFNPIIYNCFGDIPDKKAPDIESQLLIRVIQKTQDMICNIVRPTKSVYIAIDGPCPKCKMTRQRERRYKKVYEQNLRDNIKKYYLGEDVVSNEQRIWDTSNITPGTKFMDKLAKMIKDAIVSGKFSQHNPDIMVTFSSSYVPGEGEHKFLQHIEKINLNKNELLCIYSNDADLMMLANRFPDKKLVILMNAHHSIQDFKHIYKDLEYVYINVKKFQDAFVKELDLPGFKTDRIIFDFVFYNMFAGNDFVQPIYFTKMRKRHSYGLLFKIYKKLLYKHNNHLVYFRKHNKDYNTPKIDHDFLLDFIKEFANQEDFRIGKQHEIIMSYKPRANKDMECDEHGHEMPQWEKDFDTFQHLNYFDSNHPQHKQYQPLYNWFLFDQADKKEEWRNQYYKYFFGFDQTDKEFHYLLKNACISYLKSLVFTLHYYLDEIPSWKWCYPYRAAPLPSDLYYFMNEYVDDINDLSKFKKETPFLPLEQLVCVLPPQNTILPKNFQDLMNSDESPIKYCFPDSVQLDVYSGEKYIYAEPILPELDDKTILKHTHRLHLTTEEKQRNRVEHQPFVYKENKALYADKRTKSTESTKGNKRRGTKDTRDCYRDNNRNNNSRKNNRDNRGYRDSRDHNRDSRDHSRDPRGDSRSTYSNTNRNRNTTSNRRQTKKPRYY